jgi:hypothetical protein
VPVSLADLPTLLREGANAKASAASSVVGAKAAIGAMRFALTERDLTPNSPSDEREPTYSPSGEFIAFTSNGADANGDGLIDSINGQSKRHIWIMNRDGSGQRQITGLTTGGPNADVSADQSMPAWSPDGNQLVFIGNGFTTSPDTRRASNLFVARPFEDGNFAVAGPQPPVEQRTFFTSGGAQGVTWGGGSLNIAFAHTGNLDSDPDDALSDFDIFTINPSGQPNTLRRLTGGSMESVVADRVADDKNPAFSLRNASQLYFSSKRTNNTGTTKSRIWLMNQDGSSKRQVTDPAVRPKSDPNADEDDYPAPSLETTDSRGNSFSERVAFHSNSFIDTSDTTHDQNVWSLNFSTVVETNSRQAQLESNRISSPDAFSASGLASTDRSGQPVTEDRVADVEPSFARSTATVQEVAQLAFASQRRTAARPGTVDPGGGSSDTRPLVPNPTGSYDIWATVSQDYTPPVLLPTSVGNAQYPLLAPGVQSPFLAPRTFEEGLTPGQKAKIAFVLDERESGIGNITIRFYDADDRPETPDTPSQVNERINVQTFKERKPSAIGSIFRSAGDPAPTGNADGIHVITDGGPSGGERQSDAVTGDGRYYVEARWTPPGTGDFYFDIEVSDAVGNRFNYDNIWGFSNRQFVKQSQTSDLFVSDYMQGQQFPFSGDFQSTQSSNVARFANMRPVESYYLTIGATILPQDGESIARATNPATFAAGTVDIWRVLCRGPVPQEILGAYAPTQTLQIDPQDPSGAYTQRTRSLPVAKSAVIWGSPYAGRVFTGPGTILDSETQGRLTNFLKLGGRLFVSGHSVAYSLSQAGQTNSDFLRNELGANYAGEVFAVNNQMLTGPGFFSVNEPVDPLDAAALNILQMPRRTIPDVPLQERTENTFLDAADNNEFNGFGTSGTDSFTAASVGSGQVIPSYTINDQTVGQRVEKNGRTNNFQSRVVFFGFGFENVNRRYTRQQSDQNVLWAVDVRPRIASEIRLYFKTGGISGLVINNATNQPIPNFLLEVTGPGGPYFVRTNQVGQYEILGLPSGDYAVRPAVRNGRALNPGYQNSFAGDPRTNIDVGGPSTTKGENFRVIPSVLSSLSGMATQSSGTFANRSDDSPLPNVRVLLTSVDPLLPSGQFPNGGRFAQVTRTDAGGRFNFTGVPTGVELQVIFNPMQSDVPANSGIVLDNSSDPNEGQFGENFGRRVIPDAQRPEPIVIANSNPFVLNDGTNDTPANDPVQVDANGTYLGSGGPILVPVGRTINGTVFLNGAPLGAATVRLTGTANDGTRISLTTTTIGTTGAYAFFDVPRGNYQVVASFTRGSATYTNASAPLPVTVSTQDVTALRITLFRQDVSGRVLLNGAAPGVALPIQLVNASTGAVVASSQTDANGNYLFPDVAPGSYFVRSNRSGITRTSAVFVVAQFNPANGTGGDAVAPTLEFFSRTLSGIATVNGQPRGGLLVQLLDANGQPLTPNRTAATDANGAFSFADIDNGIYYVRSSIVGRNGSDIGTSPAVALNTDRSDVEVALFLQSVRGVVTLNGTPAAGQTVEIYQNGRLLTRVTTGANGIYTIDRLVVAPTGTTFSIRALRMIGTRIIDQTSFVAVTVGRGQSVQGQPPYTIPVPTLALVSQTISGVVRVDGKPFTPGVALVELLQSNRVIKAVRTGTGGTFSFADVGVGTYVLRATGRGDIVTRTITVQRGVNQSGIVLDLVLNDISGVVLLNNVPLVGQPVQLLLNNRVVATAVTTAGGRYIFRDRPAQPNNRATYQVRATRLNDTNTQTVVLLRGRDVQAPTLRLFSQTISGVVTLNRRPTGGVLVELLRGTVRVASTTTAANGTYRFLNVAPSTTVYTVRASRSGDTVSRSLRVSRNGANYVVNLDLLLQSINGTVTLNGQPIAGQLVELLQGTRIVSRTNSTTGGRFTFPLLAAGTYIVRATRSGDTVRATVVVTRTRIASVRLDLRLQTLTGTVTLDGRPASGVTVALTNGEIAIRPSVRTNASGGYTFTDVPAGVFTLTASIVRNGQTAIRRVAVRVTRGRNLLVPVIALVTPQPGPPPSEEEEFQPGSSYQISIPYAESSAPTSTTTVARAFTVPPVAADGTVNYKLFRFNAVTRLYEQLSAGSPIRRGEGYFLQPQARGVSIRRPDTDATRIPTNATEFEVILRRSPSATGTTERNNGFNLIGFPFNPARFSVSEWQNARVITPDGRRFETLSAAVAAGIVSDTLFTLNESTQEYVAIQDDLQPFRGYYARTFVDGVRVILKAGETSGQ